MKTDAVGWMDMMISDIFLFFMCVSGIDQNAGGARSGTAIQKARDR